MQYIGGAPATASRRRIVRGALSIDVQRHFSTQINSHQFKSLLMSLGDEIRYQLLRVIPQATTLMISGETGTGKSRLAQLIHNLSPRRGAPCLVVDCAALSAQLIESELFGHVSGAFSGAECDREGKLAAAGQGTMLFEEISALP